MRDSHSLHLYFFISGWYSNRSVISRNETQYFSGFKIRTYSILRRHCVTCSRIVIVVWWFPFWHDWIFWTCSFEPKIVCQTSNNVKNFLEKKSKVELRYIYRALSPHWEIHNTSQICRQISRNFSITAIFRQVEVYS